MYSTRKNLLCIRVSVLKCFCVFTYVCVENRSIFFVIIKLNFNYVKEELRYLTFLSRIVK